MPLECFDDAFTVGTDGSYLYIGLHDTPDDSQTIALRGLDAQLISAIRGIGMREAELSSRVAHQITALVEQSADLVFVLRQGLITFASPNVGRVLGKGWGAAVLLADMAKGWAAVHWLRAPPTGLGLADPVVTNRFLLIGLYGVLATITYPTYLWMYIEYERHGIWSDPINTLLGVVEIISLAALWISFSAPAFYRHWIGEGKPSR